MHAFKAPTPKERAHPFLRRIKKASSSPASAPSSAPSSRPPRTRAATTRSTASRSPWPATASQ
ncbi:hypothetical protein OHV08_11580 [Streptomyces canus]|uniref:hypothetical protein n=1 Tax=Streptomyces canus TaxID=58343 RepID=UPI003248B2D1